MTNEKLLDNNNFIHVVTSIPSNTVKMVLKCTLFVDDKTLQMQGTYHMMDICHMQNDYHQLKERDENPLTDKSLVKVIFSIPKDTIHIDVTFSVYEDKEIKEKEDVYDVQKVCEIRNNYLSLDPKDDFFTYWIINESFLE